MWYAVVVALAVVVGSVGVVTTAGPAVAAAQWIHVAIGDNHTCGIQADRSLWCWGDNNYGQLGFEGGFSHSRPMRVTADRNWAMVTAGWQHTCALKTDGSRWCWGSNYSGQLGLGDSRWRTTPTRAANDPQAWLSLSAGSFHTCGITVTRALYCWGDGRRGQIGNGDTGYVLSPARIIVGIGRWYEVTTGERHTCGAFGGTLNRYCWGDNWSGELGLGDRTNRHLPEILPDEYHSPWAWSELAGGAFGTCGIRSDRRLYCWGANVGAPGSPALVPARVGSQANWASVVAGDSHFCALKTDGTRFCWGSNLYGQLGINDTTDRSAPRQWGNEGAWLELAAGYQHTCGIKADGRLYCWGGNGRGQLGIGAGAERLLPTLVS